MKTPEIDLKELEKMKQENFRQRLDFIDKYVEWLKKSPNKVERTTKKLND